MAQAKRIPTSSTAAAAAHVADDAASSEQGPGAAICSREVIERLEGQLELLAESIQDVKRNRTRFLLLQRKDTSANKPDANNDATDGNLHHFVITNEPSAPVLDPTAWSVKGQWSAPDAGKVADAQETSQSRYLIEAEPLADGIARSADGVWLGSAVVEEEE